MSLTNVHCGFDGSTSVGGLITEWKMDLIQDLLDSTNMLTGTNQGWKQYIGGLRSATGSFTTLLPVGGVGALTGVTFINDDGTYTGNIIISKVGSPINVAGIVSYSYDFESSGVMVKS